MASLPSTMRRRLAVDDDDGDDVFGDNDGGRDGLCRRRDGVVALVTMASYDGDSTTGDKVNDNGNEVDDNGDGATGYDDDGNDDGKRQRRRRQRRGHQLDDERRGRQSPRATIPIAMTAKTHAHRRQQHLRIGDGDDTASCEAATRREAEGGASGASSSSSNAASSPPCRDGGTPREIPSNGGGSNVSRVVRKFDIGKIRASAVVVVNPLASPSSSPPSDTWRALLAAAAAAAPAATVPIDGSFGDKREVNGRWREWRGGE